jgi:hypothetical protein
MWSTGEFGIGDPSDNIKQGKIIHSERDYNSKVPPGVIHQANEIYDAFLAEHASAGL